MCTIPGWELIQPVICLCDASLDTGLASLQLDTHSFTRPLAGSAFRLTCPDMANISLAALHETDLAHCPSLLMQSEARVKCWTMHLYSNCIFRECRATLWVIDRPHLTFICRAQIHFNRVPQCV